MRHPATDEIKKVQCSKTQLHDEFKLQYIHHVSQVYLSKIIF